MERGAVCSRGAVLAVEDLPEEVREDGRSRPGEDEAMAPRTAPPPAAPDEAQGAGRFAAQKESIVRALEEHRWNRGAAAAALGMDRSTLWRKMKRLGLA